MRLLDHVHHTLGRHRDDDTRDGWLSGFSEHGGEQHPTRGGLRIGKNLPERGPFEPFDARKEWDRDGQYFHYLTKWMHALDQASRLAAKPHLNVWARELAETSSSAFTYLTADGHARRMYWKMSIDLTRPLVLSMGQHDPLDGYMTYRQLQATAESLQQRSSAPELTDEIRWFEMMIEGQRWMTPDPLGIGGLLFDAYRMVQLMAERDASDNRLLEQLLIAALEGLKQFAETRPLNVPSQYRLAFRELGLAIGLLAVPRALQTATVRHGPDSAKVRSLFQALLQYVPFGEEIEKFWRHRTHRRLDSWREHRDINEVMLATCLVPDGFLALGSAE